MDREAKLQLAKSKLSKFQQKKSKITTKLEDLKDESQYSAENQTLQEQPVTEKVESIPITVDILQSEAKINTNMPEQTAMNQESHINEIKDLVEVNSDYAFERYRDQITQLESQCQYYSDMYQTISVENEELVNALNKMKAFVENEKLYHHRKDDLDAEKGLLDKERLKLIKWESSLKQREMELEQHHFQLEERNRQLDKDQLQLEMQYDSYNLSEKEQNDKASEVFLQEVERERSNLINENENLRVLLDEERFKYQNLTESSKERVNELTNELSNFRIRITELESREKDIQSNGNMHGSEFLHSEPSAKVLQEWIDYYGNLCQTLTETIGQYEQKRLEMSQQISYSHMGESMTSFVNIVADLAR